MWPRQLVVKEIISELRVKVTKIVRQPTGASAGIVETEPCRGPIEVRIVRQALEAFGVLVVCSRPRRSCLLSGCGRERLSLVGWNCRRGRPLRGVADRSRGEVVSLVVRRTNRPGIEGL
jgi:hypothetical protein